MEFRANAAVTAGLMGSALTFIPTAAYADPSSAARPDTAPFVALSLVGAGAFVLVAGVALWFVPQLADVVRARRQGTKLTCTSSEPAHDEAVVAGLRPAPRHMRAGVTPRTTSRGGAHFADAGARPEHAARDYEDIASNYVGRMTFRKAMARRARGVAAILRERMGASMMDGLPIIERADGSVGDVGTGWWRTAVGNTDARSLSACFAEGESLAIPADFTGSVGVHLDAEVQTRHDAVLQHTVAASSQVAAPLLDGPAGLPVVDADWVSALRSMEERLSEESSVESLDRPFYDLVGGIDTLDEPDNLEMDTAFIHFRTPAGHPEVIDTESYIEYLVREELAKSSSERLKRHTLGNTGFLRLLEGGSPAAGSARQRGGEASGESHGRHFARLQAAEA